MTSFTIPATASFQSRSNPSHRISFLQLNPGAPQTLLFCYGAGDRSITLTLLQKFICTHTQLSLICIDRWTLPTTSTSVVARSGLELLSEFTSITIELLESLRIHKFSIAAHSAGAYSMLHLLNRITDRVRHLFPICTHIPLPFTESWVLSWMCSAPNLLFDVITKLDSGDNANPTMERLKTYILGDKGAKPQDDNRQAAAKERHTLDYQLVYSRLPGVDNKALVDLYMALKEHSTPVTWFTSHVDTFFGPPAVSRLIDAIGAQEGVEVIVVEEAKHSDIHLRVDVWNGIYRRMTEVEQ